MRFNFLYILPFALMVYPTIYIYILLINHNNARPTPQGDIAKAKVGWPRNPSMRPQGVRQRNRTNLLTASQSLNLLLICVITGCSGIMANVIYPAMQKQKPEIM
jgi:hypothetical protein